MELKDLLSNVKELGFEIKEENDCVWFIYQENNRKHQQFIPKTSNDSKEFLDGMESFLDKINLDLTDVKELKHYTKLRELTNHLKDCLEKGITVYEPLRDEHMSLLKKNAVFKIQNDKNNLEVLVMNKQKDLYLVSNRNATYTPYVVVTGLNKDGTWQYGSYFERYVDAYECFAEKSVDYPTCVKYLINEEMSAKGYEMDSKKVDDIYEEMMQNDAIVSPLNETIVDMIEKANDEITQTESLDELEDELER